MIENNSGSSTPSLFEFNPTIIKSQAQLLNAIHSVDYSLGVHEFLLSGSVGSAKSLIAAHLAVTHCLTFPRSRGMLGRRSLPDLKDTIFQKILEHLEDPEGRLVEGRDYWINATRATIKFRNGSEIISRSWADKKYKKFRSLELSFAVFEELTENDEDGSRAYFETKNRVGRLTHVPQKWIISCTNPDSPKHWAAKYFIDTKSPTRHVIYSKTEDNPFLPDSYVMQLRKDMKPKEALRMLDGQWIEIDSERIYDSYNSDKQFLRDTVYKINPAFPVMLNFDFNIGSGKPFSSCAYQYIEDQFHVFNQVVIQGARTASVMDEWFEKGLLIPTQKIIIHGDATGSSNDTRNILSDYDIIKKYLSAANVPHEMLVPRANPAIRTRHNRVNAYCLNSLNQTRVWIYKDAPTVDEALRLTELKKGGDYIENDGPNHPYQHIGTALGYGIVYDTNLIGVARGGSSRR